MTFNEFVAWFNLAMADAFANRPDFDLMTVLTPEDLARFKQAMDAYFASIADKVR